MIVPNFYQQNVKKLICLELISMRGKEPSIRFIGNPQKSSNPESGISGGTALKYDVFA